MILRYYVVLLFAVDCTDLSGIAMNLYTAGIDAVSSESMIRNSLRFDKEEKILEVCL